MLSRQLKVLFMCVHNSARSQMAQEFFNRRAPQGWEAHSAGLEPGAMNPLAVEVMREIDIDISQNQATNVFDLYTAGEIYAYVISTCDAKLMERRPIFAGVTHRINWCFADPATFEGTWEEKLQLTREVRDQISAAVDELCAAIRENRPYEHEGSERNAETHYSNRQ